MSLEQKCQDWHAASLHKFGHVKTRMLLKTCRILRTSSVTCRSEPLYQLKGHARAVSFVRFSSALQLVTASVDGTIKCWDLSCQPDGTERVLNAARTLRGHRNSKNFVGLSVRDAPTSSSSQTNPVLIACGSESGATHIYGADSPSTLAQWQLPSWQRQDAVGIPPQEEYISSVCWQPEGSMSGVNSPLLAVAASDGDLRLLALQND